MIKVVSLHIYPIKGMQGVAVKSAKVLERGDLGLFSVARWGGYVWLSGK